MQRPSPREIDKRLKEAKEALTNGCAIFSNLSKVIGELEKLGIGDTCEVWELILNLLDEIKIEDYDGGHPPQSNYEPNGTGFDLWAFCWESKLLHKCMYLKYSVKSGFYYYVSLHESKFTKKPKMKESI